jgi:hypothetical protein
MSPTSRKIIAAGPLPLPGEESFHQLENDGGAISPGAAAALKTLVPRVPAFAANLAQQATDGSHDLTDRSGRDFAVARASATPPIMAALMVNARARLSALSIIVSSARLNRPDHLLEAFGETCADGFVLPRDFACRRRHGATIYQIVAVIERQVEIQMVGQCRRAMGMGLGRRHVGVAARQPMRQILCNQSLLRRELGIERSVRQARRLADLRDADAADPSLPEHARSCLNERRAILVRFFLGGFHRLPPVAAGLL